jgi:hypothetical protein
MIEVEVRDFQSIEHASIRIDGFTALVGRSNIGKSAFVRAIQAAMMGAPVGSYVRHGPTCARRIRKVQSCRCQCSVHIKATDLDLLWEKGDAVNRYTFNGVVYDRAATGTPEFLAPYVAQIKMGEGKELLQIAEQFKPIFLLDQPGTVVADVLGDVAQLDRINTAMKMAEKDRREVVATRKVRYQDVAGLRRKLEFYEGLDVALVAVRHIETEYEIVYAAREGVKKLAVLQTRLTNVRSEARALAGVDAILPPDPAPLLGQNKVFDKLSQFTAMVSDRAVVIRALTGVESVALPDPSGLWDQFRTFKRLDAWVDHLYVFQAWFDVRLPASRVPIPPPVSLTEAQENLAVLRNFAHRLDVLSSAIASLEQDAAMVEREEAETDQEFKDLGVCPTCGQPLHPDSHA